MGCKMTAMITFKWQANASFKVPRPSVIEIFEILAKAPDIFDDF